MILPRWSWFDCSSWFSMMTVFFVISSRHTMSQRYPPTDCSVDTSTKVRPKTSPNCSMFSGRASQVVKSSASFFQTFRRSTFVNFPNSMTKSPNWLFFRGESMIHLAAEFANPTNLIEKKCVLIVFSKNPTQDFAKLIKSWNSDSL